MDVEKAIEFLLKNQARADARFNAKFDRADERFRKAEARLDRMERGLALNNRIVTRLVRYGVSLRSDVRRLNQAHAATERELQRLELALRSFIETAAHRNGRGPAGHK